MSYGYGSDLSAESLQSKLDAATEKRDELTSFKYELESAIDELDDFIGQVERLIENLSDVPAIRLDLYVPDFDFDSESI